MKRFLLFFSLFFLSGKILPADPPVFDAAWHLKHVGCFGFAAIVAHPLACGVQAFAGEKTKEPQSSYTFKQKARAFFRAVRDGRSWEEPYRALVKIIKSSTKNASKTEALKQFVGSHKAFTLAWTLFSIDLLGVGCCYVDYRITWAEWAKNLSEAEQEAAMRAFEQQKRDEAKRKQEEAEAAARVRAAQQAREREEEQKRKQEAADAAKAKAEKEKQERLTEQKRQQEELRRQQEEAARKRAEAAAVQKKADELKKKSLLVAELDKLALELVGLAGKDVGLYGYEDATPLEDLEFYKKQYQGQIARMKKLAQEEERRKKQEELRKKQEEERSKKEVVRAAQLAQKRTDLNGDLLLIDPHFVQLAEEWVRYYEELSPVLVSCVEKLKKQKDSFTDSDVIQKLLKDYWKSRLSKATSTYKRKFFKDPVSLEPVDEKSLDQVCAACMELEYILFNL